jgi:hypothetical protein
VVWQSLASPYGTIYSSNITPDLETGIGKWSEEAFRRAMKASIASGKVRTALQSV